MATAQITPLENVPVVDADLTKIKPDITTKYLFSGQTDFSEVILEVKRDLHRQIQDKEGLSDNQMDNVADTNLGALKSRIVFLSLAEIFLSNGLIDLHDSYQQKAAGIPFEYILDSDEDDTQDEGERDFVSPILMGR